MPEVTPLTMPVEPIVATVVLLLLQVPLPSVSIVVLPAHAFSVPLIAGGVAFTVTIAVVLHPVAAE